MGEFYEAHLALQAAGYRTVIATPNGQSPAIDPESLDPKYWDEKPEHLAAARKLIAALSDEPGPLTLAEVTARLDSFQGIVVPGGQGVMVDLLDDPRLHALLAEFARSHRPVGLICHSPALLIRMPQPNHPLQGRLVTSVSSFEEFYIETFVMGANAEVRNIGASLDEAGFRHDTAFPGSAHAVRDCNLVTSQNPFSGEAFNELYLKALSDWRRGARCVLQ